MAPLRLKAAGLLAGLILATAGGTSAKPTVCVSWINVPSPGVGDTWSGLSGVAARSATDVWAVGWQYDKEFHQYTYAQHWDGDQWSSVTTPNPPPSKRLIGNVLMDAAVARRSDVWAVGWYLNDDGYQQALAMRWDGAQWSIVPVPPSPRFGDYRLNGVAVISNADVWAVGIAGGYSLLLHWDGTAWRLWPVPGVSARSVLSDVDAWGAQDVWAVGHRSTRNGISPLALHWNGRRWSRSPSRGLKVRGELLSVGAAAPRRAWVVGWHHPLRAAGDVALAARWNGRSWSRKRIPNRKYWDNRVEEVDIAPGGEPWAVGVVTYDVDVKVVPVAFRWREGRWQEVRVEHAGKAVFWSVDLVSRRDGWAVGAGPSGVFTQRLSRCRP
jgi:hypothetical protein